MIGNLMSIEELCQYLGLCKYTVTVQWKRRGIEIPWTYIGVIPYISKEVIDKLAEEGYLDYKKKRPEG
jgi:hypothetical protein